MTSVRQAGARLNLAYAHHFKFLDNKLIISPSIKVAQNYNKQITYEYYGFWPTATPYSYSEMGGGLMVNYKGFYISYAQSQPITFPEVKKFFYPLISHSFYASQNISISDKSRLHISLASQVWGFRDKIFSSRTVLSANAVVLNRLIVGSGWNIDNDNIVYANLGYRGDNFKVEFSGAWPNSRLTGHYANIWQLATSINLRKGEKKETLTNFETM